MNIIQLTVKAVVLKNRIPTTNEQIKHFVRLTLFTEEMDKDERVEGREARK